MFNLVISYIISLGHLQHIVDSIIKQGPPYYSAIQISVQNAYQGFIFANGAVELFERLQSVTPDNRQLLENGLQNLIGIAEVGQKGAAQMNTSFKDIRSQLFTVSFIRFLA